MPNVVFVPTYNEKENLERLVARIHDVAPEVMVLVVDDRSPDGTGEIADRLAADDSRVRVLHREPPKGRGLAGRDGYLEALRLGAEVILEMDADFSHDPALIPRFFEEIDGGADMVLGSRFVSGGTDEDRSVLRRVITLLANTYIRIVLGVPVRDCNSGYRAFTRSALLAVRPETITSVGPSIVQEVLFRVHRTGGKIVEIPLRFVDRKAGDSKLGWRLLLDGYFMILRLKLRAGFGRNP